MAKRILVALSGGIDSAVATAILQQQGHDIECAFMHNWHDDNNSQCQASKDYAVALEVAEHLGVNLHSVDFATEYFQEVFSPFLKLLQNNLTPNPDVLCNKNIKFKYLINYANQHGFDFIATGHYADVMQQNNEYYLYQAKDTNKDQTYFLHQLTQKQLAKTIFPLANLTKQEVRKKGAELNLPNQQRKESMGICFIGEKNFQNFIQPYLISKAGDIITTQGEKVGSHQGLFFYTIGQRKGIGIGGNKGFQQQCWYVVNKNIETNQLVVSQNPKDPLLYSTKLACEPIHWINKQPTNTNLTARIRHRQELQACLIRDDHIVEFSQPQRAIAPGQYIVFYHKGQCLGGAIIKQGFN